MNATRSDAKAIVSHRLAMRARVDSDAADRARLVNGGLIFDHRGLAEGPIPCGCPPTIAGDAISVVSGQKNPAFEYGGTVAIGGRLNAFFAISVNSPPVSMVNFSCCVCSAPNRRARGVTRTVTPQPMCAAVRMEAGVHAGV
jgi:hypothetical protein